MTQTNFGISQVLLEHIKASEGLRLKAYKCPAGRWTVGYGHTHGVRPNTHTTAQQALSLLRSDIAPALRYVNFLGICKTQGQADALTDFAFNCGIAHLSTSTLLLKITAKSTENEIRKEFLRWIYAGGKVSQGLVKRRQWEADRFFE